MALKVTLSEVEQSRGHVYAIVRALDEGSVLFADRIALDRAADRASFAKELLRIEPTLEREEVDRKLLSAFEEASRSFEKTEDEDGKSSSSSGGSQATKLVALA